MKAIRYFLIITAFAASLFYGYRAGKGISIENPARANPLAQTLAKTAPEPVTFLNGQSSILVIGADDLTAASPRLESVWLVILLPPDPHFTLIPIYPQFPIGTNSQDERLSGIFEIEKTGETNIGAEFLYELRQQDIWWSDYVVFDRHTWQTIADSLKPASTSAGAEDAPVELTGFFERLSMLETDKQEALFAQADIYREICRRISGQDSPASTSDLIEALDGRLITSAQPEEIMASIYTLDWAAGVRCEFPTLSQNASE